MTRTIDSTLTSYLSQLRDFYFDIFKNEKSPRDIYLSFAPASNNSPDLGRKQDKELDVEIQKCIHAEIQFASKIREDFNQSAPVRIKPLIDRHIKNLTHLISSRNNFLIEAPKMQESHLEYRKTCHRYLTITSIAYAIFGFCSATVAYFLKYDTPLTVQTAAKTLMTCTSIYSFLQAYKYLLFKGIRYPNQNWYRWQYTQPLAKDYTFNNYDYNKVRAWINKQGYSYFSLKPF